MEDIELGYRLIQEGYKIRLNKNLQIKHLKKWTLLNLIITDIFHRAKPWSLLLHKYQNWNRRELNTSNQEKLAASILFLGGLSLITTLFWPSMIIFTLILISLLIFIKRKLYVFFTKHFNFYEIPIVIVLHFIYLLCAVIGYILSIFEISKTSMITKAKFKA